MGRQVVRMRSSEPAQKLGSRMFRKQMMRYGRWLHPDAKDGELVVDRPFLEKVAENFHAGVRDTVPIPLSHKDKGGITSIGRVVDVEVDDEGLWGYHLIAKPENAAKIDDEEWRDSSVLVEPDFVDKESGRSVGPALIHNAITNAAYMTGLAPFEAVAFGEDAAETTVLDFGANDGTVGTAKGGKMDIKAHLAAASEVSDEDFLAELRNTRPDLLKTLEVDTDSIKTAARKGVIDELAEEGIVIDFEAIAEARKGKKSKKGKKNDASKVDISGVDISDHPAFVALSDEVTKLTKAATQSDVESRVDKAIREGKATAAEKKSLVAVGFADSELLDTLLDARKPNTSVGMSELGFSLAQEPGQAVDANGVPKVDDTAAEAKRYLAMAGSVKSTT